MDEEARIMRHFNRSLNTAQGATPSSSGAAERKFTVTLEGLPAQTNAPVSVVLAGKQVYHSGNQNGAVSAKFSSVIPGQDSMIDLQLKIASMGFDNVMQIDLKDGWNLLLKATPQGLEKKQQSKPF
eukprot:CAMPEP_0174261174 /NCGR_PEP_ID=MMETSP0439-20130205/11276_1 /TAXON_ID=0 /ORGANISM="Stereomyxa ramosa, Strain Chinc5" /LENGTH=125 /DNA_ID=CAMNT_0015345607 /DNA_START=33 /DNA_END=410 /DNA_ORIENTATION=+